MASEQRILDRTERLLEGGQQVYFLRWRPSVKFTKLVHRALKRSAVSQLRRLPVMYLSVRSETVL